MTRLIHRRQLITAAAASLALPRLAYAQAFPNKPIRYICPWPAGGSTDAVIRAIGESAAKILGQTVIVDNKPGAGGMLGANELVNAKPDGYTIAQFPLGMLRYPHMQKVAWDPINDFSFIIGISGYTFGFVVRADSPYKTFNEYIEAARKSPNAINYGSTGIGTSPHLLMEEVADAAKVQLTHIPFKGNADQMQALLGGHVMAASDATGWDKFVDGGQMRLLVTFGDQRTARWPNVPTAKDLGYNVVSQSPYGIVGPKGMDPAVVRTLHDAFRRAMDDPNYVKTLERYDQPTIYMSGEEYTAFGKKQFESDRVMMEKLGLRSPN